MGTARLLGRLRHARAAREVPADEITAELTASYWRAYDARMASVGFRDVARRFPGLVAHAVRLGWSASRLDTAATIALNLVAAATAARSGISTAAGWAQSRLEPRVDQAVEVRLFDLTSQVELTAFDDPDFH